MFILGKEMKMNRDILKGKWMQLRGEIKETWGELTDDEVDQIEGNYDKLIGKLQENYGYSRNEAEEEINSFMDRIKARHGGQAKI
jgi:uncharacterized protein YjbJ (UPF0337 family)